MSPIKLSNATNARARNGNGLLPPPPSLDPIIVYPVRLHRSTLDGLTEAAGELGGGKAAGLVRKVLREWVEGWQRGQGKARGLGRK